jgi:hypothetical protein
VPAEMSEVSLALLAFAITYPQFLGPMKIKPMNWELGDGVTIFRHSDRITATVVRVSVSGCTIWMQDDCASLDPPDWKPVFDPGELTGICINQHGQRYHYHRDIFGRMRRASLRNDGVWRTAMGERIVPGRSKFHDFNIYPVKTRMNRPG